jgi:hypothetical protein
MFSICSRLKSDGGGSHKGFAFAEYADAAAAATAIRLLNGRVVGGRPIKLDYSSSDTKLRATAAPAAALTELFDARFESQLGSALSSFSAYELWAMVSKFRELALRDEASARTLLEQRPVLAHALAHMHRMLGSAAASQQPVPAAPLPTVASSGLLPLPTPAPVAADPRLRDPRLRV